MIDDAIRAFLPRFAGPMLALYARMGWSPNQVSVIGFAIALAASVAVATGHPWVAFTLWWVSRIADGTDGVFARQSGRASDFGAYLDVVLDMAAYGAMVLAFAWAHPALQSRWMTMLFLYVLCIASALALGAQEEKRALPARDERGLRLGAGLAEGGETGIAYSVFLLLPHHLPVTTILWLAILVVTVVARTLLAWRLLGPAGPAHAALAGSPDGPSDARSEGKPLRSGSPADRL